MLSGIGHAEHLTQHGITAVADLPVGDNLHDHMFHAMTFHVTTSTMRGNAVVLRQGRREGAAPAGQDVPRELGLRVGGLRAYVAGDRRTRPAAAPAAVVLRLAQPGRADPPRRRPAPGADCARDADLPEEPRHPAPRLGRPDGRAADRLPLPLRPGRPRGAGRGIRDGPRDHGAALRSVAPSRTRSTPARTCRARTCAARSSTGPRRSTTGSAPAGWASTTAPSSVPTSRSAASTASASPTPRSCRRSPAATPTRRRS